MRVVGALLLLLPLAGCQGDNNPDDDDGTPSGLEDPYDYVEALDRCESQEVDGVEYFIEGGSRYLIVDGAIEEDDEGGEVVRGVVAWVVAANSSWLADEADPPFRDSAAGDAGKDWCHVVYALSGAVDRDPSGCTDCLYGIEYLAERDELATDCPQVLTESFSATFEGPMRIGGGEDDATLSIDGTRMDLVYGSAIDDAFSFTTEGACVWFGSSE